MKMLELWNNIPDNMRPKIRYWLPAAAIDGNDLRLEIQKLKKRGFGGVEIVVLPTLPVQIAKSDKGWGTEKWNKTVRIIADETEKLGMSFDLAIGPAWPIASKNINNADSPAAARELTYGVKDISERFYCGKLPEPRVSHDEGTSVLIAAFTYNSNDNGELIKGSFIDLTKYVSDNTIEYTFPNAKSRKLFAFYVQPTTQKTNGNQTYVIDHLNKEGAQSVADYWKSILDNNNFTSLESLFCDSLEYQTALDWTERLPEEFEKRRGYSIIPYLPFIGLKNTFPVGDIPAFTLDDKLTGIQINNDYLETVTELYCENHLDVLESFANNYGKTIRYQVAYNKPFEAERSALYVSIPENEALGRASIDFQKTMAAAAHVSKKERYSFECAAEFGSAYSQNYEDLFWWIKRSYMAGMNAQVFHGASYSGKYPYAQWPGYEGFGKIVSNYWNRTLSEEHSKGCLDTIARMNIVFRGKAKIDCAIYRSEYINDGVGNDFCIYNDNGVLANHGFSYEFLSDTLLERVIKNTGNGCIDNSNTDYRCLIIPEQQLVSKSLLRYIGILLDKGITVIYSGNKPVSSRLYSDIQGWNKLAEKVLNDSRLIRVSSLEDVPAKLIENGIIPRIQLNGKNDIMTAVRETANGVFYLLYGYNRILLNSSSSSMYSPDTVKDGYCRPEGKVKIEFSVEGIQKLCLCNPWSGKTNSLETYKKDGRTYCHMEIGEDELVILSATEENESSFEFYGESTPDFYSLNLFEFIPDTEEETSFLRSGFSAEAKFYSLSEPKPWKELSDELEHFSGKGIYNGRIVINKRNDERYVLYLGEVCDTATVKVNGIPCDFPDQTMKCVDITEQTVSGVNEIEVEVVSNLYNKLFNDNTDTMGIPIPVKPQNYGMFNANGRKIRLVTERSVK